MQYADAAIRELASHLERISDPDIDEDLKPESLAGRIEDIESKCEDLESEISDITNLESRVEAIEGVLGEIAAALRYL